MDDKKLDNVFLSASIPIAERDPKYIESCDITAIRDAVIALASLTIKDYRLIWGGHPAITPIISRVIKMLGGIVSEHVILYQSNWFTNQFPKENNDFPKIVFTEKKDTLKSSLIEMRNKMIGDNIFKAAFFIGGMEGVEREFSLLKEKHPSCRTFPIASTGAAAKLLFERHKSDYDEELEYNLAYMSLFRKLLRSI